MGNNNYTPFDNNPPKPAWDDSLLVKHDIASYLRHLNIIACLWWMEKFFDTQEFADAAMEIQSLRESMKS